jgi:hypothetical protein
MERHDPWPLALRKWLSESRDLNPYATADTLRAWDNVIRNKVADALEASAARWRDWYQTAQRALPVPSRDHPLPDPAQMEAVRTLKRLAETSSDRAAAVRALEMPAHDRVFNRIQNHALLLDTLIDYDAELASCAETLHELAAPGPLSEEPARRARLEATLDRLQKVLEARREAMTPIMPG